MAPSSSSPLAASASSGASGPTRAIVTSLAAGIAAGYFAARAVAASSAARRRQRKLSSQSRADGPSSSGCTKEEHGSCKDEVTAVGKKQSPVSSEQSRILGSSRSEVMDKADALSMRERYFCGAVSVSYSNSDPLMIVGGQGSHLVDSEGRAFLDTRNNVCHVGHQNSAVVKAVQSQVATLNTNTRYLHPNASLLAKRLASLLPDPLNVVFLVNSGSEANDLALRLARAYTGNRNTIVVEGAYHGHTLACLEVSPYKYEHSGEFEERLFPQNGGRGSSEDGNCDGERWNPKSPGGIWKVPRPDTFRGLHRNPETAVDDYSSYVKEACASFEGRGEGVGSFMMEGGMSVAGVILPPTGYIRKCVDTVRHHGGLFIVDEVQTGFGRLGSSFWAFQHGWSNPGSDADRSDSRVIPDIVTCGKPFGNGMPLAAVVTTREVSDKFEAMGVELFCTFGGNPVSCAAGLAVLDEIERLDLQTHAHEVGAYIKDGFWDLSRRLGRDAPVVIGDIRGSGLFIGVELVRDMKTLEPASAETSFICSTLKEKYHVLTSIDGPDENVFVIKPPLVFTKTDADKFLMSFEKAVEDLHHVADVGKLSKTPT